MTDVLVTLAVAIWLACLVFVLHGATLAFHAWARHRRPHLHAAGDTLTFTAPGLTAAQVNPSARTIAGLVIPWNEYGETSVGRVIARSASAIRLPADLSRIKLVATGASDHFDQRRVVGYATAAQATAEGLHMTFSVGRTPEGDRALMEASEHLSDALSVELSQLQLRGDEIVDSQLSAVAQLGVPAFASARVLSVTAAHTTPAQEGTTMTEEQRARLQELLSMNSRTPEQEQEFQTLSQLAVTEAANAGQQAQQTDQGQQAQQQQQQQQAAASGTTVQVGAPGAAQLTVVQRPTGLATAPVGLQAAGAGNMQARPLADLYAAVARTLTGHSRPELEAALSDITQGANTWVTPDQYAGQLWSGIDYTRRWVQLSQSGELTSYKGTGWRWVTAPEVDDYPGDKAAVPSNAPETEDEPWVAARLAGAHDMDRKFADFGDTEFIAAYYHAMTMSYARKSDAKARAFQLASATAGAAVVGNLLKAAAVVAQRVENATDGASVDWVIVNDQDKLDLLDMTDADVPAFLETLGITPDKFLGTPDQPAGTVTAGNKNATEFKELPGSPIRVETVNIVNGGIDGGVFGYYATLLHDAAGIQKATFAPA